MRSAPSRISEIYGYSEGKPLDRSGCKASNLFAHPANLVVHKVWSAKVTVSEVVPGSYLCVAMEGIHGVEGAYAALQIDDELVGTPDRAVSYPSNVWENQTYIRDRYHTYYFPMKKDYEGKAIEVVVLDVNREIGNLKIDVWQTAHDQPFISRTLLIHE